MLISDGAWLIGTGVDNRQKEMKDNRWGGIQDGGVH